MKLITFAELKPQKGIGYCRIHLMRKVEAGEFPQPVQLSDRRIAWIEEEVDGWVSGRAALRRAKEAA